MPNRPSFVLGPLILASLLAPVASARADWERHVVPEGSNAYTVERRELRVNLLGRSAFGISSQVELSTYLLLDAILFPNLELKVNVHDGPRVGWALSGGVGAGVLPYAGGGALPYPPVAVGVVGLAALSIQQLGTQVSLRASTPLTLSLRGSVVALEAGTIAAGAVAAPQAVLPVPFGAGTAHVGGTAGAEADWVLDGRNVLVLSADAAHFRGARDTILVATLGWTHAWRHAHLTVGAYSILDAPDFRLADGSLPLGPYVNAYWTWR
jgi:hypothetical protein